MKAKTKRLLAELQGLLDGPAVDLRREMAIAELCSAACLVNACGLDVTETAADFTKLHALPRAEWPALFQEAREGIRRTSSDQDTPSRLTALEALIEAVKGS